jgi:hypothetical protein
MEPPLSVPANGSLVSSMSNVTEDPDTCPSMIAPLLPELGLVLPGVQS